MIQSIVANGKLLTFDQPVVMGIINATKDSFYSRILDADIASIQQRIDEMIQEGVTIIDIGGMSTRPYAEVIPMEEEWSRVAPILKWTRKMYPQIFISIDTYRGEIVRRAVSEGVDIINDISAGSLDSTMLDAVSSAKLPYIAMHMQGNPQDMQDHPSYADVTLEVMDFAIKFFHHLKSMDIHQIIFDPGFGFGKDISHNYTLLRDLKQFQLLQVPLLAGMSRKGMLWKVIDKKPEDALAATITAHTIALLNGANILRVQDVAAAVDSVKIYEQYMKMLDTNL